LLFAHVNDSFLISTDYPPCNIRARATVGRLLIAEQEGAASLFGSDSITRPVEIP